MATGVLQAHRDKERKSLNASKEVTKTLSTFASNLWGLVDGSDVDSFRSLTVKVTDEGSFLAMARRYSDDGSPEIAYGSSGDFVGSLLALSTAISKGAWRPDKFAK